MYRFQRPWQSLARCKESHFEHALVLKLGRYNEFHTPSQLATLTDLKLKVAGIDDKEDRKMTLAAMKKSGYLPIAPVRKKLASEASTESSTACPSTPQTPITTVEKIVCYYFPVKANS